MNKTLIAAAFAATIIAMPTLASAQEATAGAATGAAVGAGTGFVVGGPVGAAVGAGVGGTVGAAAGESNRPTTVIVEPSAPARSSTDCVRDAYGNESCTTIRR